MKRRIQRVDLLTKREEKLQVKKSFLLSFISVVIAVLIFTFGIGVLGGFADLLNKIFTNENGNDGNSTTLQAPLLDELPSATNGAKLKISGLALEGKKVFFYLGDEKTGESDVSGDRFSYEDFLLKEGENEVRVKSQGENEAESDFSKSYRVIFDQKEPELAIDSPTEGQTFSGNNRISVKGKSEKNAKVYANGFLANENSDGNFEVYVPLNEGDNEVEVKAIDIAGNSKSQKIKVRFNK